MNNCRRIPVEEWEAMDPKPQGGFDTIEECEDGCGVCCANICSSCSFNALYTGVYRDRDGNASHDQWVLDLGNWYYNGLISLNPSMPTINPTGTGNLYWKTGYPDLLAGTAYAWILESHSYSEFLGVFPNFIGPAHKTAQKQKYTLLQCRDGTAADITDTAVFQADKYETCFGNGQAYLGKILDWTRSYDDSKFDNWQTNCSNGWVVGSWSGNISPQNLRPPSFLSCTQRECREISKTLCDAADGTWNAGLDCAQVNCNP